MEKPCRGAGSPPPRLGALPPHLPSFARLKAALLRWGRLRRTGPGAAWRDWPRGLGKGLRWRKGLILVSDCVTLSKSLHCSPWISGFSPGTIVPASESKELDLEELHQTQGIRTDRP